MNNCLNCKKIVKNKFCSNKCQREYELNKNPNPLASHTVKCFNCEKEFQVLEKINSFPTKEKYYCSRSCANSRKWNDEHKKKLSKICKNSEKVKIANKNLKRTKRKDKIEKKCPVCENKFKVHPSNSNTIYCSRTCYLNDEGAKYRSGGRGGLREGLGTGKKRGMYKGYYCDSSWELAFVIYNLEHNIKFERNLQDFKYIHNGKEKKYYPDFIMENNNYLEIKGYFRDTDFLKIQQFPYKLEVMDKIKMKPVLEYVKNKYGKNFIKLYENHIDDLNDQKRKTRNNWTQNEIDYLKNNYDKMERKNMTFLLKRHTIHSIKTKENSFLI